MIFTVIRLKTDYYKNKKNNSYGKHGYDERRNDKDLKNWDIKRKIVLMMSATS